MGRQKEKKMKKYQKKKIEKRAVSRASIAISLSQNFFYK